MKGSFRDFLVDKCNAALIAIGIRPSKEMLAAGFRWDPTRWLTQGFYHERYRWEHGARLPDDDHGKVYDMDAIYGRYRGTSFISIEKLKLSGDKRTLFVDHIGISPRIYEGLGIGPTFIRAVAWQLRSKMNVEYIEFWENHSEFEKRNYVRFFKALKAIQISPDDPRRWRWKLP
ncbi:hypothetical protein [Agrobacterium fabrum]|uniref:hypothetical protein n=1 Tax=Agrobacterium fabrum TaxID=1176649 RepID=UPI000EF4B0DE|nr:hypothetical protein [Agrobacterium fabrum]AYM60886.1 hypothetical protein At1D132_48790 [Agrobacterium fabrum]NSZ15028.1 hypothetical protein [Agrobacterium fabrum]